MARSLNAAALAPRFYDWNAGDVGDEGQISIFSTNIKKKANFLASVSSIVDKRYTTYKAQPTCVTHLLHTLKTPPVWSVIENSNNRKEHTNRPLWRQLHNLLISTSVVATATTTTRRFAEKPAADPKDKRATTFLVNRCLVRVGLEPKIL